MDPASSISQRSRSTSPQLHTFEDSSAMSEFRQRASLIVEIKTNDCINP